MKAFDEYILMSTFFCSYWKIIHFPAGNVLFNLDRMKGLNKLKGTVIPSEHYTNVSGIHSKLHWIVEASRETNMTLS